MNDSPAATPDQGGETVPRGGRPGRWWRALPRRLGLALASLVVTLLLLELGARLLVRVPPPVHLRDGVWRTSLPLVNGRPAELRLLPEGGALPKDKVEGELRVFVFGESSVEGSPFGQHASPATMLYDQLRAALPDRPLTVVNMGRVGSYTMDAFYFLLTIEPYAPDVVVFYLGANDRYDADAEMCWPVTHPTLHGTWRWLVARSRLLWAVRALLPQHFAPEYGSAEGSTMGKPHCDPAAAFARWTDLLVGTAGSMGASVVVTLPVINALSPIDYEFRDGAAGRSLGTALEEAPPVNRGLLRALLAAEPLDRAVADWSAAVRAGRGPRTPRMAPEGEQQWLGRMGQAWRRSAATAGAAVVDLPSALRAATPGGLMGPPLVLDEVHLSMEGYWLLASAWSRAILPLVGAPGAAAPPAVLPPERRAAYDETLAQTHVPVGLVLAFHGAWYLEKRLPLLTTAIFQAAEAAGGSDCPSLALGWLRARVGLDPGLSAAQREALTALGPDVPAALSARVRAEIDAYRQAAAGRFGPPRDAAPTGTHP